MRVLLDTNSLIWFLTEPSRLSPLAKHIVSSTEQEIAVSLVSLWELAIKIAKGNLPQVGSSIQNVLREMDAQDLNLLPVGSLICFAWSLFLLCTKILSIAS